MSYQYWIESYGCQMNMAEATALENKLALFNWIPAEKDEDADLVILNTCAVRESAETRIWGRLAYFKALKNRHFRVAVMGCMAERLQEKMKEKQGIVDFVVGNFHKEAFIQLLQNPHQLMVKGCEDLALDSEFKFAENHGKQTEASAFVPIMQGCNNFCTYCIVPYVRGREISRGVDSILSEINQLVANGIKEITLLGQNVNSYTFTENGVEYDFPKLLKTICEKTSVAWLRFTSSHPKDLSPKLAEIMAEYPQICNQLHLPIQHGSNSILKAMNRKYTTEDYLAKVEHLRTVNPNIGLSTDILIGFPGETEDDFNATISLLEKIKFDDAFTYYYNIRSGTPAATMDGHLSLEVKNERLAKLIEFHRKQVANEKLKEVGQIITVLVEKRSKKNKGEWLGRSERNRMVVFQSDAVKVGDFCKVKLLSLNGSTFKGEVII